MTRPINRRSAMFFTALEPGRLGEAARAGTDIAVFDLEDGVAAGRKAKARATVADAFAAPLEAPLSRFLRINAPMSVEGVRDLAAVLDWTAAPDGVVVPKAESAAEIAMVRASVGALHPDIEIMPIVETPLGLEKAYEIAAAPGVTCLLLGLDDLSGALGSDRSFESLAYARGRVVAAAAAAGVEAMDGPWRDPDDEAGLIRETRLVAAMGFQGKASYHAGQIPHIHAAFTPSPAAVTEARDVVQAAGRDTVGLLRHEGRVINAAVVKAAERLLALARRRGVD